MGAGTSLKIRPLQTPQGYQPKRPLRGSDAKSEHASACLAVQRVPVCLRDASTCKVLPRRLSMRAGKATAGGMSPEKLMQLAESMASKQVQKLGKLETYEQLLLYLEVLQVGCPQGSSRCAAYCGGCCSFH